MKILLYHWHAGELEARAAELRAKGHDVTAAAWGDAIALRDVDALAPDAVVIDLRRLPSHGRVIAMTLRERKSTRGIPLVFVEGDPDKTERMREQIPDATFTPWSRIAIALRGAHSVQPKDPVVPRSTSGYSGKPLPQKLGVKPGTRLTLLGAPKDFATTLGTLPQDVVVTTRATAPAETIVLFAKERAALEKKLPAALRSLADKGALWAAWPKKASGVATDLVEDVIREVAFAHGLVDVKVCAVDATWSSLCLRRRVSVR